MNWNCMGTGSSLSEAERDLGLTPTSITYRTTREREREREERGAIQIASHGRSSRTVGWHISPATHWEMRAYNRQGGPQERDEEERGSRRERQRERRRRKRKWKIEEWSRGKGDLKSKRL
jgi:hypothetical protein